LRTHRVTSYEEFATDSSLRIDAKGGSEVDGYAAESAS